MYNVLSKIRAGETLTAKDKVIHEQGLVSVLQTLHDELDAAVLDAYGWSDLLASPNSVIPASAGIHPAANGAPAGAGMTATALNETILERLVALNSERAREEANGQIRWLRPAYQCPQTTLAAVDPEKTTKTEIPREASATPRSKHPWPAKLPEQMALLVHMLATTPQSEPQLAAQITGKGPWKKRLPDLLQTLAAVGRARQDGENWMVV